MGGNAIKSVSVSPIKKDEVKNTLREIGNQILKPLGLSKIPIEKRIGGSLLYKEISGDIDIFVERNEIGDLKGFYENLKSVCNSLGIKEVNKAGTTISIYFPQYNSKGEITDSFVQVDFVIVSSLKFSKDFKVDFQKTKYKNAHMQLLLNSILKYITLKKIEDDIVQFYGIHPFNGIQLKTKQKNPKTGKYKEINKEVYSYNINDAISLINQKGYNITIENLSSFESLYDWMKNNIKDSKIIDKIKEEIIEAFKNTNLIIPKELNENMKLNKIKFNAIVAVGRFQPFHKGHLENIKRVVLKYPDLPLYILNVYNTNNKKTLFSPETTEELIETSLENNLPSTPFFIIQKSLLPDAIDEMINYYNVSFPVVWVFGNKRKETNSKNSFFYINGSIVEGSDERIGGISGTKVRKAIYNNDFETFKEIMCSGVNDKETFKKLRKELTDKINEVVSIFKEFYEDVKFLKEDIVDVVLQLKAGEKEEIEDGGKVEFIEDKDKEFFKKAVKFVVKEFDKESQEKLKKIKEEFYKKLEGRGFSEKEIEIFWKELERISLKINESIQDLPLYKFILNGGNKLFDTFIKSKTGNLEEWLPEDIKSNWKDLKSIITSRKGKNIGKGEILLALLFGGVVPETGDVEIDGKKIEVKGANARLKETKIKVNQEEGKKKLIENKFIEKLLKTNKIIGENEEINDLKISYFALNTKNKFGLIADYSVEGKTEKANLSLPLKEKEGGTLSLPFDETNSSLFKEFLKAYYGISEDLNGNSYFDLTLSYYLTLFVEKYNFDYLFLINTDINSYPFIIIPKNEIVIALKDQEKFSYSHFTFFAGDWESGASQITFRG